MITSGTYFVFPSESNLEIDSTDGLVKIVLPTAEAISTYISGSGGQVPEVIAYTIVGAATNPVRFYRGGGLLWNNGAEYLEITADGSGTISRSSGIESISESVLNSGGNGSSAICHFMEISRYSEFNEFNVDSSGDYVVQLELYASHNLSEVNGLVYSQASKNGNLIDIGNAIHEYTVFVGSKLTYTHTYKISAISGESIGFLINYTRTNLKNGSITLIKAS